MIGVEMDSVEEFESALEPIIAGAGREAIAQCWLLKVAANRAAAQGLAEASARSAVFKTNEASFTFEILKLFFSA